MNYIKNQGKVFEDAIKKSVPSTCWIYRLRDNAASFAGGSNTRFASSNICDYIMLDDKTKTLYLLELKSTQGAITYWNENFKSGTFMVKKNQIQGLQEASKHKLVAGFIFNFRQKNNATYFMMIDDFIEMIENINKKSFNLDDVIKYQGVEIDNSKIRTNYRYDIEKFVEEIHL